METDRLILRKAQRTGRTVIYVHGKGGNAGEAEHYRPLFAGCDVIGFDYGAKAPWEAKEEFLRFFDEQRKKCASLTVMHGGEHWFHTEEQMAFLDEWIRKAEEKK